MINKIIKYFLKLTGNCKYCYWYKKYTKCYCYKMCGFTIKREMKNDNRIK